MTAGSVDLETYSVGQVFFDSPIGWIEIKGTQKEISSLRFLDKNPDHTANVPVFLRSACRQIEEYFLGIRREFDLKLALTGTDFQKSVWSSLEKIPFGETVSYQDIARHIKNAKAMRAVGNANRCNPIAIILPCHRVIGSDGKLVGFGGGLWRKEWLLRHERNVLRGRSV